MTSRPSESAGVAAAVAVLLAYLIGIDDAGVIAALALVVGLVPGIVTWIVVLTGHGNDGARKPKPKR